MGRRTATIIADPRTAAALAMYEREVESHIAKIVADLNKFPQLAILHHHTHRSEFSSAGVPDDTFVNPRIIGVEATMYFECKRECRCRPGRVRCAFHPSADQQGWMDALEHAGHAVYLIRPSDILSGRAGRLITDFSRLRRAA